MICNSKKRIVFLGTTVWGGAWHDFSLLKNEFQPGKDWFKKLKLWMDNGYLGFEKHYACKALHRPEKKPRRSAKNPYPTLTDEQKKSNSDISKKRILVEHAIGGMKRYNILVSTLRTRCERFINQAIGVCAALWNYKTQFQGT